jgi:hypothetical protein
MRAAAKKQQQNGPMPDNIRDLDGGQFPTLVRQSARKI